MAEPKLVTPKEVWVIDTSSVIHPRRIVPKNNLKGVFKQLDALVTTGALVFPKEVLKELERWANPDPNAVDLPLGWTKSNEKIATRHGNLFEVVKVVLAKVPDVLDPDKGGVEEADPYVLALATHLQESGHRVTVITQERKDTATKISMTTAGGLLGLPCVPIEAFLKAQGIWPSKSKS